MEEPEDEQDVEARNNEDEDREASDEALLEEIDRELAEEVDEHDLAMLTRDDINVGRFSIYKVSLTLTLTSFLFASSLNESPARSLTYRRRFSTILRYATSSQAYVLLMLIQATNLCRSRNKCFCAQFLHDGTPLLR
jgi:hypothetical protein